MKVMKFIHADPHSGNVFVRKLPHKPNKYTKNCDTSSNINNNNDPAAGFTQLILLDHGLYKSLTPELKYAYSLLWKGLLNQDESNVEKAAKMLGVKNYYMFASMITSKDWHDIMDKSKRDEHMRLAFVNNKEAKKDVQVKFKLYMREILECLQTMNNDILLILKVNEYLRSIDANLGNPVNSFIHIVSLLSI